MPGPDLRIVTYCHKAISNQSAGAFTAVRTRLKTEVPIDPCEEPAENGQWSSVPLVPRGIGCNKLPHAKQDFSRLLSSLFILFSSRFRWGWYIHVVSETPGFDRDPPVSSTVPLKARMRPCASANQVQRQSCAHVVLSCTPNGFHPNTNIPPCAR